jgi:hypothetical protein
MTHKLDAEIHLLSRHRPRTFKQKLQLPRPAPLAFKDFTPSGI